MLLLVLLLPMLMPLLLTPMRRAQQTMGGSVRSRLVVLGMDVSPGSRPVHVGPDSDASNGANCADIRLASR